MKKGWGKYFGVARSASRAFAYACGGFGGRDRRYPGAADADSGSVTVGDATITSLSVQRTACCRTE